MKVQEIHLLGAHLARPETSSGGLPGVPCLEQLRPLPLPPPSAVPAPAPSTSCLAAVSTPVGVGGPCEQDTPCDFPAASYPSTATHPFLTQPASSLSPSHVQGHPRATRASETLSHRPTPSPAPSSHCKGCLLEHHRHPAPLPPAGLPLLPPPPWDISQRLGVKGSQGRAGQEARAMSGQPPPHPESLGLTSKKMQWLSTSHSSPESLTLG